MTLPILLGGILLAATLFGATLYSLVQAIRTNRLLRLAHIALIIGVIAGMSAIEFLLPSAALAAGLLLILASLLPILKEPGATKLLPAIQLLFGILLALGIPFAA